MIMSKKVIYHISGFDCANCAAKVERFLNKQEIIQSASLDFNNERLYLTYKDEPLQTDALINLIKEVESDPLRIEKLTSGRNNHHSIFDKKFFVMAGRILASFVFMILGMIFENNYVLSLIFNGIGVIICLYDIVYKVFMNIIKLRNPLDMNLLLTISTVGVFTLSILVNYGVLAAGNFKVDLMDGVMVIALYQLGELFEHIATGKSKDAISNAVDLRADTANLITNNKVVEVKPETLKIGDKILVRIGEIVPADGEIVDGQGTLDVKGAIANSCNISLAQISSKVGQDVFTKYQRKFGFGQYTDIDLPNEMSCETLLYNKDNHILELPLLNYALLYIKLFYCYPYIL